VVTGAAVCPAASVLSPLHSATRAFRFSASC
jgi:hypothetical protein